jgi:TonB-dependent receptor
VVGANNFAYTYGDNSRLVPRWFATDPAVYSAIHNGSNYQLTSVNQGSESVDGQNVGGALNALIPYSIGNLPASFKIGVKYYNEHKSDNPNNYGYSADSAHNLGNLGQYESNYTVNGYYGHICGGCYPLAPFGSIPGVQNALGTNSGFTSQAVHAGQLFNNLSGSWSGTEQVSAIYAMQTLDVDLLHINIGIRAEQTHIGYEAFSQDPAGDQTVESLIHVHKQHTYGNLFPSALLRFALDENTNLRASIDFAIARPDYADLVPTFNFPLTATPGSISGGISAANPSLKPERSVNYDLLAEHYFPSVGVLSAGAFYKQISDFIFNRVEPYNGQFILEPHFLPSNGQFYYITQKQNGPSAWEYGFEADYTQHMTFLPGALRGIGFDVNWTYVHSQATVPQDTTVYHGNPFRHAMLQRQFPNLFNTSLLYDYGPVSARLSGEYQAASIYNYGQDGSSNPQSGDNWNFPHWQIDASLIVNVYGSTAIQFQVLNLNDETFGFFNGNGIPGSGHGYDVQREYTGRTFWIGVRQGI